MDLASALKSGAIESAYDVGTEGALTAPYARVFGVFWNLGEKRVYARAEVRRALSLALDRQSIIDTVLGGYATAIMGPVPPGGGGTAGASPAICKSDSRGGGCAHRGRMEADGSARLEKCGGKTDTRWCYLAHVKRT